MAQEPVATRAATLREVAERAGVSISTASRALNGGRHVRTALAERVQHAATEVGYRANEAARGLRISRTMTFGMVFPRLDAPVQLDMLNGLTAAADHLGYSLLVTNARGTTEQANLLINRLFERRVDGILLANPSGVGEALRPFRAANVPALALFSRGEDCAEVPLATVPETRAVKEAVDRLAELGHRSLMYVTGETALRSHRPQDIEAAAAGISCRQAFVTDDLPGPASEAQLLPLLRGPDAPTAVIVAARHLPGLLAALSKLRLSIPTDRSVVTFTDSLITRGLLSTPIASIHVGAEELGKAAIQILEDWLDGQEPPNVTELDLAEWHEAGSVGPAPATTT